MNASLRRALLTVADTVTDAADLTTALIGGAAGAWLGYTHYPASWSEDGRLAATGTIALITALALNSLAGVAITPARRTINTRRAVPKAIVRAAATSLEEGLAQVAAATAEDAAHRAAEAAWHIDRSSNFLADKTRWRGFENAEAVFYLAPGVYLHHESVEARGRQQSRFSLVTGDGDRPVTVTRMEEIHHRLAARAAGLPVAADIRIPQTEADLV
ncbi:hypothetical protein ACH41H_24620 [Streptomyces sp. NPDC020800]|uniref:hypothetical protein n=1 Tax=Streptomyces sp. NPDC020800 TaxID=3365092 RepID=UPI0037B153D3